MTTSDEQRPVAATAVATIDETFDNGLIGRFNAWFFTALDGPINHMSARHKGQAFGDLDAAHVVELGAGTGANLHFLRPGTVLHAIEPNRRMHSKLRTRAHAARIDLRLQPSGAERIDLPDATVDDVICSLVLCTVAEPDAVIEEVRRVLRPGGRFRFVEHVAATRARGAVQRSIRRPWGRLFEGCDPHRDTAGAIRRAGFAEVTLERRMFRHSPFWPINTAIWGVATR